MVKQQHARMQGTVAQWQDDRGFGFIAAADKSFFFHISEYQATASAPRPEVGEVVTFIVGKDEQGRWQAQKVMAVTVVSKAAPKSGTKARTKARTKDTSLKVRTNQQKRSYDAKQRFKAHQSNRSFIALGFYLLLIMLAVMEKITWLWVGWYAVIGVVTFLLYAKDKYAAQHGQWRTPESTLHLLSVIGGWAGAMLAQNYLRHKSKKVEFRTMYYLTVIINLAGLLYILAEGTINN